MKFFAILFIAFAIFQTQIFLAGARALDPVQELDEEELACINELHLSKNRIKRINSQDIKPENDDEFNDFLGCSWQRAGLQNPMNGNINYHLLEEELQEGMEQALAGESPLVRILVNHMLIAPIRISIDECKNSNIRGKNHGQTAVKVQNCVMRKLNELCED